MLPKPSTPRATDFFIKQRVTPFKSGSTRAASEASNARTIDAKPGWLRMMHLNKSSFRNTQNRNI